MIETAIKDKPGTKVRIREGFFAGRIGEVDAKQEIGNSGFWINIRATDNGPLRRLWFPAGDLVLHVD